MQNFLQLVPLLLWTLVPIPPMLTICRRAGKTRWWTALVLLPMLGVFVFLFVIAYSRWPVLSASGAATIETGQARS